MGSETGKTRTLPPFPLGHGARHLKRAKPTPARRFPPAWRVCSGGFLPRIVLRFDFDHASRAKGEWSDPARVIHNSPRAGPLHCWISLASLRVLSNPLSRVMFRNKTLDHFRFAIGP